MIRTKELKVSLELRKAWEKAIVPIAVAALAEFRGWPLLQRVSEPWPDAPPRIQRVASLAAAAKAVKSTETTKLWETANPGLRAMYLNLSTMLNSREHYFDKVWQNRVERTVLKATKAALKALGKRLKWEPAKRDEGFWLYRPNNILREHAWERLHSQAVEAPFHEHFLSILRAGYYPAGLQGNDWKTCRFLYF